MGKPALSAGPGTPAEAPRKAYQVLGHLHVDGKDYAPHRDKVVSVMLTEDEARDLQAVGVVGPMPPPPEPNS